MRAAALLVVVLALPLLAGCISGQDGITAKEAASKGLERARTWQGDAFLMGLGTVETANASLAGQSMGGGFIASLDPKVGDGRSGAWGMIAASLKSNATLFMIVFGNGTIFARDGEGLGPGARELARWDADSPRLAESLRGRPELAEILNARDATLGAFISNPGNNVSDPLWTFSLHSGAVGREAHGVASGRNGDLLEVQVGPFVDTDRIPNVPHEPTSFQFDGTVSPGSAQQEHPFPVDRAGNVINVQFQANPMFPGDGAEWTVVGPDGKEVATSKGGNPGMRGGPPAVAESPGAYRLVVTFTSQAPAVPIPGSDAIRGVSYHAEVMV